MSQGLPRRSGPGALLRAMGVGSGAEGGLGRFPISILAAWQVKLDIAGRPDDKLDAAFHLNNLLDSVADLDWKRWGVTIVGSAQIVPKIGGSGDPLWIENPLRHKTNLTASCRMWDSIRLNVLRLRNTLDDKLREPEARSIIDPHLYFREKEVRDWAFNEELGAKWAANGCAGILGRPDTVFTAEQVRQLRPPMIRSVGGDTVIEARLQTSSAAVASSSAHPA